jgi:GNAT superfamily N-acetyltransferase
VTIWCSIRLTRDHDLGSFDCGVPSLDEWLTGQAHRAQEADTARTWVWTAPGDAHVVAYFSVCPSRVERQYVGARLSAGYSVLPVYLLARLALDQSLHGQGLGTQLLLDALTRIVDAASIAGGRLIVVDAIDEHAARFYRHHDFQPVRDNPRRLVMKMATVAKILGGRGRAQ